MEKIENKIFNLLKKELKDATPDCYLSPICHRGARVIAGWILYTKNRKIICLICKHKEKLYGTTCISCKKPVEEMWGDLGGENEERRKTAQKIAIKTKKLVLSFWNHFFVAGTYPKYFNPKFIIGCPHFELELQKRVDKTKKCNK